METVLSYPKAIMTLEIPDGVNGQQIIDAAHAVVERNKMSHSEVGLVKDPYYRDDDVYFILGQDSKAPYEDLILSVVEAGSFTNLIHPEGGYTWVRVVSHHWPSRKYAVGYDDTQVVDACRQFRDELGKLLGTTSQPGE